MHSVICQDIIGGPGTVVVHKDFIGATISYPSLKQGLLLLCVGESFLSAVHPSFRPDSRLSLNGGGEGELVLTLNYSSLLNYIGSTQSPSLDTVCPGKLQTGNADTKR